MFGMLHHGRALGGDGDESFGVHITYENLYLCVFFLASIYSAGMVATRILKMPALVGEIFCGIILGPSLLNFVPYAEAFVLLGEIGLILLVIEAGVDIDLTTLKLIGKRGLIIALVGTFLPVLLAYAIAYALGYRGVAAIAAGCSFAPTSLGIAMNVLRQSNIANTPVGQLIVAAAIVDDMIALVILSQLQAFTGGDVSIVDMSVPILSALAFLSVGGYIAVFILPKLLDKYILDRIANPATRDWVSLCIMFCLLLVLLPATYYCKASPLMGAFLAGLAFCSNPGAHHMFVSQCKRPMHWLLRIFFAASIGFQVPVKMFGEAKVLLQGAALTLALLGKVVVGFMAPNFSGAPYRDAHLRDCLVIGFSMAAEGEFAFVIAAFAVSNQMITQELYASIVLAVLVSTIVAPFSLRSVISYYNARMKETLVDDIGMELNPTLAEGIKQQTTVFYCIQTKTTPEWGVQAKIIETLIELKLDVIDHRSWHPRHSPLLINEIYAKDMSFGTNDKLEVAKQLDERINVITGVLKEKAIRKDDAMLKVQRWFPERYLFPHESETESSEEDMNERLIQATTSALHLSMRDEEIGRTYIEMSSAETKPDPTGYHLGDEFNGHLDGLIRRDPPRKVASFS